MNINTEQLDLMIEKASALQKILEGNPSITEYLRTVKELGEKAPAVFPVSDRLVTASSAAKVLCTSVNSIYRYVAEKRLYAYYTPGSSTKKFRLSDLWKLAERSA